MQWIKLKDTFPSEDKIVLVAGRSNSSPYRSVISIGIWYGRTFEILPIKNKGFTNEIYTHFEAQDITHWMALPVPPGEGWE